MCVRTPPGLWGGGGVLKVQMDRHITSGCLFFLGYQLWNNQGTALYNVMGRSNFPSHTHTTQESPGSLSTDSNCDSNLHPYITCDQVFFFSGKCKSVAARSGLAVRGLSQLLTLVLPHFRTPLQKKRDVIAG